MNENEKLKKENEVLKAQLLALKYYLPKPIGEAEPEEYQFEIERALCNRYEKWEKHQLVSKIIELRTLLNKMREKLHIQRLYNQQGWQENYERAIAAKEVLQRNYNRLYKENIELRTKLNELKKEEI